MNNNISQFSLKHRPTKFEDVKGQDLVVRELKNRSLEDNWPNAFMFQGPTGVGKTTLGFIAAALIQCSNPQKNEKGDAVNPCGECPTCKDIFQEKFSLGCTLMLDGGTSSKDEVIDQINNMAHSVPIRGKKNVFIVEEIDQLSSAAKNAFHKMLEKPSPWVHFILLSMTETNGDKVPTSIADRCQLYHLKKLNESDIAFTLRDILVAEGKWNSIPAEFKKDGIFLIANNSKGSLRKATQSLERILTGGFYSSAEIEEVFQFIPESSAISLLETVMRRDKSAFEELTKYSKSGSKLTDWVFLSYHYLVTALIEKIEDKEPDSPASKMLRKYSLYEINSTLKKLYTPIVDSINGKGWIGNTQLLHFFAEYIMAHGAISDSPLETLTPVIPGKEIRTRGSK